MSCTFLGRAVDLIGAQELPLVDARVPAGFPSPAADHIEKSINLQRFLVANPAATFLMRVDGDSMVGAGINHDDLIVVDRSVAPVHGKIVVAQIDGEFMVKRLAYRAGECFLESANPKYKPIPVGELSDNLVWGVVVHAIKNL